MRWLVCLALAAGLAQGSGPERRQAIERGLRFIYQASCDPKNFAVFGEDFLWCFYSIGSTSRDPALAREALSMGRERAAVWIRENAKLPANPRTDQIANAASGAFAAERLGLPGTDLKEQIRQAAPRHTAEDYLRFDVAREAPPSDVPEDCPRCSIANPRGAKRCFRCGARLTFRSRYEVWYEALTTTYFGDRYGAILGAPYAVVIGRAPAMRPYRARRDGTDDEFYATAYAVAHVVYTRNDYSRYSLSRRSLPQEFAFLKANIKEAIAMHDPEMMGEFLDTLKSFGLRDSDPVIRTGMRYLVDTQNPDGSWGDAGTSDVYLRYHPTWTAIDGLRDYNWQRR